MVHVLKGEPVTQAAIEEKQVLLRRAYKLATQAEARSKQLQQELDHTVERCL